MRLEWFLRSWRVTFPEMEPEAKAQGMYNEIEIAIASNNERFLEKFVIAVWGGFKRVLLLTICLPYY